MHCLDIHSPIEAWIFRLWFGIFRLKWAIRWSDGAETWTGAVIEWFPLAAVLWLIDRGCHVWKLADNIRMLSASLHYRLQIIPDSHPLPYRSEHWNLWSIQTTETWSIQTTETWSVDHWNLICTDLTKCISLLCSNRALFTSITQTDLTKCPNLIFTYLALFTRVTYRDWTIGICTNSALLS